MTLRPLQDEENFNAATHALGLACGLAAGVFLGLVAARRGSAWQLAGCAVYAATLVATYAASTLSHVFRGPRLSRAFRIADQALIFLFIAGTYTPVALTYLRGGNWWLLHGVVWGIALAGFVSKVAFEHRVELGAVSVTLYVLLGWVPVLAAPFLWDVLPGRLMLWYLAGGLCYMAGIVFFTFDNRVRYFHAAWHLMVVAGSTLHFIAILAYCTTARA